MSIEKPGKADSSPTKDHEENEIIIERNGQPYLKVVPVEIKCPDREPGSSVSLIEIKPEFYDPMTDKELKEWGMM